MSIHLYDGHGRLRRSKGLYCLQCHFPLNYYSDIRRICGMKSLFVQRELFRARLRTVCRAPLILQRVIRIGSLGALIESFVYGSYEECRRVHVRCKSLQLTFSREPRTGYRELGCWIDWADFPDRVKVLVSCYADWSLPYIADLWQEQEPIAACQAVYLYPP